MANGWEEVDADMIADLPARSRLVGMGQRHKRPNGAAGWCAHNAAAATLDFVVTGAQRPTLT